MNTFHLEVYPGPTRQLISGSWMLYLNRTDGDHGRYLAPRNKFFTLILKHPDSLDERRNLDILLCHILGRRRK